VNLSQLFLAEKILYATKGVALIPGSTTIWNNASITTEMFMQKPEPFLLLKWPGSIFIFPKSFGILEWLTQNNYFVATLIRRGSMYIQVYLASI